MNCRQYYGESSEARAQAYEGLTVSLGPDGASISSILTQPVLNTGTETLLTVEPKVNKAFRAYTYIGKHE